MPDILLVHTPDKKSAASRLRAGLEAAGYRVDLAAPGGGTLPARAEAAAAVLLLWSRAAMGSAEVDSVAEAARRRGRLIEISADGIMPVASEEANRVALVSGWRGEPTHPGWKRVLAELTALAAPSPARPAAPVPAPAATAEPLSAAPAAAAPRGLGRGLAWGAPLLALLLVVGLAFAWIGRPAPGRSDRPAAAAAVPPAEPAPPAPAEAAPAAPAPSAAPPSAAAPLAAASAGAASAAAAGVRARPAHLRRAVRSGPIRYSRRNARVMRLFCRRAGRFTPQCRLFRRWGG